MITRELTLTEIALLASTRAMLGAGTGLLLSGRLREERRNAVGWTLVMVGVVTTIPLLLRVLCAEEHTKLPKTTMNPHQTEYRD